MRSLLRLLFLGWVSVIVLGFFSYGLVAVAGVLAALIRGASGALYAPGSATMVMLAPIAVFGLLLYVLYRLVRGVRSRGRQQEPVDAAEEARMMREIHHALTRMEDRIEALETILLDRGVQFPAARDTDRWAQAGAERGPRH